MINELLKIKYPFFQGPMANIADASLAATISNLGGLGIIAAGGMLPTELEKEIKKCKSLTDNPFGVNIMLMNPYKDELIEVALTEGVKVITTGAGNPGPYIKKIKAAGSFIIPVVPSVSLAKRMERLGADAIIAEGTEAGGHIGEQTTFTLIPQIADAVKIPVIAAGGIGDHRGYKAALILGAQGVQVGTALLVSDECKIHDNYKNAIIKASDLDTTVTGRSVNAPVRVLRNQMTRNYQELEKSINDRLELEKLTLGSLKKAVIDGDIINGSMMAGQIAGLIKKRQSASEIMKEILGIDTL